MAELMVMTWENEAEEQKLPPSATKSLVDGRAAYERELRAASAYRDGGRLRPSSEGKRVRTHDGRPRVDAGPFGDPALSGFYVVEAADTDAAVRLAEGCPLSPGGEIEVRPLESGKILPDKASARGRVFAGAVLGRAANEEGWVELMDRFDEATRGRFAGDRFLGGVRLVEPGRGRRVASRGGRRAVLDGPFLESKEIIGGLFFVRVTSLDEAVEWARESAFIKHGTVEIRELWRS